MRGDRICTTSVRWARLVPKQTYPEELGISEKLGNWAWVHSAVTDAEMKSTRDPSGGLMLEHCCLSSPPRGCATARPSSVVPCLLLLGAPALWQAIWRIGIGESHTADTTNTSKPGRTSFHVTVISNFVTAVCLKPHWHSSALKRDWKCQRLDVILPRFTESERIRASKNV